MDEQYVTHIVLQQYRSSSSYSEWETVAASHLGIGAIRHLHTLGLIEGKEVGGELRYSEEEVTQLRLIRRLQRDLSINLAGVEVILRLLKRLEALQQELEQERNQKRITSMRATDFAEAAMRAWEAIDMKALASLLSDDFVGRGLLPQPVRKAQFLGFMQAIMMAMPDWSFHDRFLDEGPVTEQGEKVFFITQITGTHTCDLILPDIPVIPPTGTKISLPYRHLEYFVNEKTIMTLTADFSPNALEEILAQMGMVFPW